MGGEGGRGPADRQGERMTKWQQRAPVVVQRGFRAIKTDRQTKGEEKRWRSRGKDGGRDQQDETRPPQM